MWVEVAWNFLDNAAFRIKPYSIAESDSFLDVQTVTGRPDSQNSVKPDGIRLQQ